LISTPTNGNATHAGAPGADVSKRAKTQIRFIAGANVGVTTPAMAA
jgi:hypothetical protein